MSERLPDGAVESKGAKVASGLMGVVLATISIFSLFALLGLYGLMTSIGTVTLTGWTVLALLLIPLGFALSNAMKIARGAAWRIFPWVTWKLGFLGLAFALHLFLPYYYPLFINDSATSSRELENDVG